MGFPIEITEKAFKRQKGLCAYCGKLLVWNSYQKGDKGAWNAHHRNGNKHDNKVGNCVCLCINEPENCHLKIGHQGAFNGEFVLAKSDYDFWNGD